MAYSTEDRERFFEEDWESAKQCFNDGVIALACLPEPENEEEALILFWGVQKLTRIAAILMNIVDDDQVEIASLKARIAGELN